MKMQQIHILDDKNTVMSQHTLMWPNTDHNDDEDDDKTTNNVQVDVEDEDDTFCFALK